MHLLGTLPTSPPPPPPPPHGLPWARAQVQAAWRGWRARRRVRNHLRAERASMQRKLFALSALDGVALVSLATGVRAWTSVKNARAKSHAAIRRALAARKAERHTERHAERYAERHTERHTERHAERHAAQAGGKSARGADTPAVGRDARARASPVRPEASAYPSAYRIARRAPTSIVDNDDLAEAEALSEAEFALRTRKLHAAVRARERTRDENAALIQARVRGRRVRLVTQLAQAELTRPQRPFLSLVLDELGAVRLVHRALIRTIAAASEVGSGPGGAPAPQDLHDLRESNRRLSRAAGVAALTAP